MKPQRTLFIGLLCLFSGLATAEPPHHHRGEKGDSYAEKSPREMMAWLKENHPEKFEHLLKMRSENPEEFRHQMGRMMRRMHHKKDMSPEMKEHHERMKVLSDEFAELLYAFKDASEKEQNKLRGDLQDLAAEMFDMKQEGRRARLDHAKQRIVKLETEIQEREEKRDELIEEWLEQKIGDGPRGL